MLTPVEEYSNILFKREDLYKPYDNFISGGKIRQCRDLVEKNLDYIKEECDSTISTAASINSSVSPIVSRVAKEFKLKSIIGFGNTTLEKALKHKAMRMCKELDSELVILSESQGFNNVLYHNLNKLSEDKPMFKILFSYAAKTHRESIIGKISEQVENVDCDVLYVPVGSGVTLTGILEGKKQYNKQFKIVALQPFGYDRTESVYKNLDGMNWEYDFEFIKGKYPYHKLLKKNVGFELDMIYESKAYEMMENMIDTKVKNCFWVIGNTNLIR